jgi:probable F420-dependent oxidoreductase
MLLANLGWDLHEFSGGRFVMGLGSQIKPHITKRFSMPWSDPAARMQEMIEAIRCIWTAWNVGEKLAFRGKYYRHLLMTPMFDPGPNPFGNPPILLAGVGPLMTKVAGRVADGFVSHAFQTADYLREVTMPSIEAGLEESGRRRDDFQISMPVFVVSGMDEAVVAETDRSVRKQIAFYGSTPAYRPVLEHHGWGEAQDELNRLSKEGKWDEMGHVIDDAMLDAFAIVAEPEELPDRIRERFGGLLDRIQFHIAQAEGEEWEPIFADIRAI